MTIALLALIGVGLAVVAASIPPPTAAAPTATHAALEGRWARVDVHANLTIGLMFDPSGERSLWLGIGNWTFTEGSHPTNASRALLTETTEAARARFTRTSGSPIIVEIYTTMGDAEERANASQRFETSWAHTYWTTSLTLHPDAVAARLQPQDDSAQRIVDLHTGLVLMHDGKAWRPAAPDAPTLLTVRDADVLVEDDCRFAPDTSYSCIMEESL